MVWNKETLAAVIDHTLLKPQAKPEDIERLCEEAINYHFASVCINPCYVSMASKILSGTGVKTCTVIGFPLGANETSIKVKEAQKAIEQGASEIDMVINVGMLKSKILTYVGNEIKEIVDIATKGNAIVKVIIETCLLDKEEKITACKLAVENGAAFVKTSTGFNGPGAQVSDVALMRETVGYKIGVKASGGIRDYQTAVAMLEAGASRIGTSAGVAIIETIKDS
ncbi:deoxyribose-phosphate aldolase [Moorella thermoacetica Y72]|uniref:Deoxyribose-phosphate aldolase n=1 Tax=Moorella thermoacetica Y72 TaxID=1325331 RepID=A0A0S6UAZ5_NEOTH|nr:deoxyribose-phosphate aldolase [Moorella thermoacetica]GAF25357.1 deoxyribose-phosphate aldolase [Moorella thermoacetica Y72]